MVTLHGFDGWLMDLSAAAPRPERAGNGPGTNPETKRRQDHDQSTRPRAGKHESGVSHTGDEIKRGQFDPGSGSIKTPGAKATTRTFAASGRGASRSR
jgi:hypothetical protein